MEVEYASEFRYRNPIISEKTLCIVISQSGETADTLAAMREAKRRGARALGIVNVVGSTIARESDGGIYIHAGPEIGVASTKAFTQPGDGARAVHAQARAAARAVGARGQARSWRRCRSFPGQIAEILDRADEIEEIAEEFKRRHELSVPRARLQLPGGARRARSS